MFKTPSELLRSPSPSLAGSSDWNLNHFLLSKGVLQTANMGLDVKEWKIFQGKLRKALFKMCRAWKRKEKISKLQTTLGIWKILFCSDVIYLNRFPLRRVKDEAANCCRERSLFLTVAETEMKDGAALPARTASCTPQPPEPLALGSCPPSLQPSRKGLAPCRTLWVLWLGPFEHTSFLSRRKTRPFQISFSYNMK